MITSEITSNIVNSPTSGTQFNLQADSYLFDLLTSKVYSDPMAAAIREISTNAYDACIEAGVHPSIEVHLPVANEAYFSVRDYGTGMSSDTISTLYSTVGASSKRTSNEFNGCMGIGKLAPLSYTSSFQLTSYYEGYCYSYLVTIQNGIPTLLHLSTIESTEPSGLSVSYPVAPEDFDKFITKAINIYQWFDIKPITNIPLNYSLDYIELTDDILVTTSGYYRGGVLMGNILYEIPYASSNSYTSNIILKAPIGAVSINPGRESLSLDASTAKWIQDKTDNLTQNIVIYIKARIAIESTIKDRYLVASTLCNKLSYSLLGQSNKDVKFYTSIIDPTNAIFTANGYIKYPFAASVYELLEYNSKARKPDPNYAYFSIMDTPVYINDLTVAVSSIKPHVLKNALIFTKPSKINKDDFISAITSFLDTAGVTYTLYSSVLTDTPKARSTTSAPAEHITVNTITLATSMSIQTPAQADTTYYYLPVSGTQFINEPDKVAALVEAYKLLRTKQELPPLVGLNKRSLALATNNPNFIPFEAVVQSLLDQYTFINFPDEEQSNARYISYIGYSNYRFTNPPSHIQAVYTFYDAIKGKRYTDISRALNTIRKHYVIKYITLVCPISTEQMDAKYPLYRTLEHYASQSHYDHYLALETHYDPTCLTIRQHTYTNTADPDDHNYTLPAELLEDSQQPN